MEADHVRRIIYSRIDELPTLPAVVPRILKLMEDGRSNVSEVTEAVSRDPALAAKILKAANSAYYGFPQKISDLERAVALLGFNMVRSLALSIGVIDGMGGSGGDYAWEALWIHSLAVASAMKLTDAAAGRQEGPSHFVVGLLHDVGKVVMHRFFPEAFDAALGTGGKHAGLLDPANERAVFGMDHGEVGAMLLERWKFPVTICEPIARHHGGGPPADADTALLRVADALARKAGFTESPDLPYTAPAPEELAVLGLEEKAAEAAVEELAESEEKFRAFVAAIA